MTFRISRFMHFQFVKLLLTICPATILPEVQRLSEFFIRSRYPIGSDEWTAVQEGTRLQPLVAAARIVSAADISL
jgi:hypothetical protein